MPSQGMKGEALTTCKLGQNTAAVMGSGDLEVRHTHVHFIAQRQKNKLCQSVVLPSDLQPGVRNARYGRPDGAGERVFVLRVCKKAHLLCCMCIQAACRAIDKSLDANETTVGKTHAHKHADTHIKTSL
jgi:hypothetical protein